MRACDDAGAVVAAVIGYREQRQVQQSTRSCCAVRENRGDVRLRVRGARAEDGDTITGWVSVHSLLMRRARH